MSGDQMSQTLPTGSSPGCKDFLPGSQPAGVASPVSLTNWQARICSVNRLDFAADPGLGLKVRGRFAHLN
jgi:hypothetical protein